MKKIIILILVFSTCNCFSQNSVEKSELYNLKTISKTNKSKDSLKSTFTPVYKPVLSHFGVRKNDMSMLNDSIVPKMSKEKQISKNLKPKLAKTESYIKSKDTIPLPKKNIKK